jgi:hypothetical protein
VIRLRRNDRDLVVTAFPDMPGGGYSGNPVSDDDNVFQVVPKGIVCFFSLYAWRENLTLTSFVTKSGLAWQPGNLFFQSFRNALLYLF